MFSTIKFTSDISSQEIWRLDLIICVNNGKLKLVYSYNQSPVPERIYLFLLHDTTEWEIYTKLY